MRKVIFAMSVSVDSFIETASGDISWSSPGPELQHHVIDRESTIDTHLYRTASVRNNGSILAKGRRKSFSI
jgi:hypothetical protein